MLSLIYFFPVFGVCDKQDRAPVVFRLRMFINRIASCCFSCSCPIANVFFNSGTILDFYVQAASSFKVHDCMFSLFAKKKLYLKAGYEDKWLFPCLTNTCYYCRKSLIKTDFCENK